MNYDLAKIIDHTLLQANATEAEIVKLAEEAKTYQFASVCVNPTWVKTVAGALKDTPQVKVCTVIGFPLGATTTEVKAFETTVAIENGATEVDMVINVGCLKDKQYDLVEADIKAVVEAAKGALTKVILETVLLTKEEIEKACQLSVKAGADFVKTSTGFSTGGATVEDVALMRKTVGQNVGVKASGGVRSLEDALSMVQAGANRIGASSSVSIITGLNATSEY